MKKLFALTGFLLSLGFLGAQNLQFSQVLYFANRDTVPVGKVWKVEKVLNANPNSAVPMYINNDNCGFIGQGSWGVSAGVSNVPGAFSGPLWLPAGTILGNHPDLRFSVVEFTVIP